MLLAYDFVNVALQTVDVRNGHEKGNGVNHALDNAYQKP